MGRKWKVLVMTIFSALVVAAVVGAIIRDASPFALNATESPDALQFYQTIVNERNPDACMQAHLKGLLGDATDNDIKFRCFTYYASVLRQPAECKNILKLIRPDYDQVMSDYVRSEYQSCVSAAER